MIFIFLQTYETQTDLPKISLCLVIFLLVYALADSAWIRWLLCSWRQEVRVPSSGQTMPTPTLTDEGCFSSLFSTFSVLIYQSLQVLILIDRQIVNIVLLINQLHSTRNPFQSFHYVAHITYGVFICSK